MENYFRDKLNRPCLAAIADLKKSGLSLATIKAAQVSLFNGRFEDLKKILGFANANGSSILQQTNLLQFPYFNEDNSIELSRFKPVPQIDSERKYLHPLNTPARPYILPEVWAVKNKTSKPIWITEGEKKALKLYQHGRHPIALPGIWAFKAGKNSDFSDGSKEMWACLKNFGWHGRTVYMAFDMDLWTNPQVRYALYEISLKLMALGAIVKFPRWSEGKGIDDYLVSVADAESALKVLEEKAKGIGEFADQAHQVELLRALSLVNLSPVIFEQLTKQLAKTLGVSASTIREQVKSIDQKKEGAVAQFFDRFVQIRGTDSIIDTKTKKSMPMKALMLEFPTIAKMWKYSDSKRVIDAEKIVFKPNGCAEDEINLFRGIEFKAETGKHDLILELLDHLALGDPDLLHWITCWLAYPIQNIGAKMRTTLVFHGGQGSGKNLIFQDLMCGIYNDYASYLTQDRLEDKYTDWMSGKLFIVCDEVLASKGKSKHANQLKTYITQPVAPVRRMYEPYREEENHANFVFLSNETMPVLIDPDDRRYVIIKQENKREKEFYKRVAEQIYSGGRESFTSYLLSYDLGDFNEHSEALMTEAKEELIALCEPSTTRFAKLWAAGELEFPYCTCTSESLYNAFSLWCLYNNEYGRVSMARFSTEMGRIIDSKKISGILKGQPRFSTGQRITQRKGWIVDLTKEVAENWFSGGYFGPTEVDQTAKFQSAVEDFRKKVENARLR